MSRLVLRCRAIVGDLHRGFSSGYSMLNKDTSTGRTLTPESILTEGFIKMQQKSYKKSEKDAAILVEAGKNMGIPEDKVRKLYNEVDVKQSVPYLELSPGERAKIDEEDIKAFGFPKLEDVHAPFEYDDIPSLGHIQLEEHRKQRHYNRIAAYELPQLSQFCTPYTSPKDKDILQFTYRAYLGEYHPNSRVVTLKFDPRKLGLNSAEFHKFLLIAGVRYDYSKNLVTMTCSKFKEQAQNKRYLGDLLNKMLRAAKDQSESFEDIPLDTRHVQARLKKKKSMYPDFKFPADWKRPQDAPKQPEDVISSLENLASLSNAQ